MNILRNRFQSLWLVVAVTVGLSSCTNIQDDGTRTRTEGTLAGAGIGALAGAIIGNQSGNAGAGALIGGAVGGLAGLAYGNHVANKKAQYRSEEAWLDACIAQARSTNQAARDYNRQLSIRIGTLKTQIAAAKTSGSASEKRKVKTAIVQLQREANGQLKQVDGEIKAQQGALGQTQSSRSAALRTEVTNMRGTRNSLNGNIDRLASLANSVDA